MRLYLVNYRHAGTSKGEGEGNGGKDRPSGEKNEIFIPRRGENKIAGLHSVWEGGTKLSVFANREKIRTPDHEISGKSAVPEFKENENPNHEVLLVF